MIVQRIKSWLRPFVIKHFVPDYEQLQNRNSRLVKDIENLVMEKDYEDTMATKIAWRMVFEMEEITHCGSRAGGNCEGLINKIK